MSHLKQTLHNIYTTTCTTISTTKNTLKSLGVVPQNFQFQENLGILLSNLMLLMSISLLTIATFILSLLSLLKMTLKKLLELFKHIVTWISTVPFTLCRWEDVRKSITSMLNKLPRHVWSEVGGSHRGSTSAYSETHGEHSKEMDALYKIKKETNEQLEKAMKAEIKKDPSDAIRKAGW